MLPSLRRGTPAFLSLILGLAIAVSPVMPAAQAGPSSPARAAAAAPTLPVYHGVSGGSRINVAGVVKSDLTGASSLRVDHTPRSTANTTANVNLFGGLVKADTVSTYQRAANILGGGASITSEARIAGVSLLNGLISVDAIETTAVAKINAAGDVSRTGGTKFVHIHIKDQTVPINVPKNFGITIPGVATVVLNRVQGQLGGDALIKSQATGIFITLLKPSNGLSAGASIEITPTMARILLPTPIDGEPAFGFAYSTRAQVHVGNAVNVLSAPVAVIICPAGGTNGADLTNGTARVMLPGLADIKGIANTANATVTANMTDATLTSKTGAVNLLNGAITLDAITSTSHVHQDGSNPPTKDVSSQILNLTIGGNPVPVNVSPNTVIEIPGLVRVVINEQSELPFPFNGKAVMALHVTALPNAPDNIAGLDLEVGVAAAWVSR